MNSFAGSARGRAAGQLGRGGVRQHDVSFFGLHFRADAVESASARSTSTVSFIGRTASHFLATGARPTMVAAAQSAVVRFLDGSRKTRTTW